MAHAIGASASDKPYDARKHRISVEEAQAILNE